MTDDVLALLESGPETATQLATYLEQHESRVHTLLKAMARDGLVKPVTDRWALASYVLPAPPTPKPVVKLCEACDAEFTTGLVDEPRCKKCRRTGRNSPPVPILVRATTPEPVSDTRTIVVDGVEFEAVSVGSRPVTREWPTGSGSSLADLFELPRL